MATSGREIARRQARRYRINENLFLRQMGAEDPSFGASRARSPAGARGPAQLMPETARSLGVSNPDDPNQAYAGAARLMRDYLDAYHGSWQKALTAYNAGPGRVGKPLYAETRNYIQKITGGGGELGPYPDTSTADVQLGRKETFDEKGYEQAKRRAIVGALLAKRRPDSPLLRLGVLPTRAPDRGDYTSSRLTSELTVRPDDTSDTASRPAAGTATFEGRPVADWMVPALRYARAQGWHGRIASGVRSRAEQEALYRNPRGYPVAKPGESNHEVQNGGALDVDPVSAPQLARIMRRYKGRKLVWAKEVGLDDPVHFSWNGH